MSFIEVDTIKDQWLEKGAVVACKSVIYVDAQLILEALSRNVS